MKVYKIEAMFIDFDDLGEEDTKDLLENARYPNHIIGPSVVSMETRDIGEWRDDHPLNSRYGWKDEYRRMFAEGTEES